MNKPSTDNAAQMPYTTIAPKEVPTVQDFVSKEINVWGWTYVEDLFNEGYEPTFDMLKGRWVWLQQ